METNKLREILRKHKMWLNNEEGGEKADLSGAYLSGANLNEAGLSMANLRGSNLYEADLRCADLYEADLRCADLKWADLRGANLDYESFPLSCDGLGLHLDDMLGIQLLYHAISNILFSKNTSDELKEQVSTLVDVANKFHRVEECGELKPFNKEDTNDE